ncbi:hypothetical protein SAMN04487968_103315 [Nocardioides terrae]|uniref:Uncharacterized protein n=1 Tax=Nocardioides terrae TaxID=574651 RepID=A0A1I1GAX4_9ACTN|nr:hypothetical protein [Nocardioides terrae]SFC08462.1 hypothetical protein SAMN04487968_103315 [Nocardioides terrae]
MRSQSRPIRRPLSRPVSRRSVQGLLAGAVLVPLAGCDLRPDATSPTPPPPTADERLVDATAAAIRTARDVAARVPEGRALVGVHEAHLTALGAPSASASPSAPAAPAPADLRATEGGLESTLTDAATRASDGALARLLASMAASVAQHLAALPNPKASR